MSGVIRRALAASTQPVSVRSALLAALAAALLVFHAFYSRGAHRIGWQIDEAYKLSETYALHHLLRGELHHPDWFRTRIDRTNPPFGKYMFGMAILIAGQPLPEQSTLTRADSPLSETAPNFSDAESAPFLPLRGAARMLSMLATALCAGVLAYLASRVHGLLAAIIGVWLFAMHWVPYVFGANAIFDPLLTALTMLTAPLLLHVWRKPEHGLALAPLLGILSAMAFQTRLNGAIAIVGCIVVLIVAAVLQRRRIHLLAALLTSITFAIAAIAINPYYWSAAPEDPAIPAEVRAPRSLVPRLISRVELQVRELSSILDLFRTGGVRLPLWAAETKARARTPWNIATKSRYLARAIAGDGYGFALAIGALAGAIYALVSRRREALFALVWCGAIIGGTCVWLPIPWSRYLFVIVPPLALLGGIGLAAVIGKAGEGRRVMQRATG